MISSWHLVSQEPHAFNSLQGHPELPSRSHRQNSFFDLLSTEAKKRAISGCHSNEVQAHKSMKLLVLMHFTFNPLSAAGVDALPLRVVFKNSKLRNSFFAPLLTASWVPYLYKSPSKPSLWTMPSSIEICVPPNLSPRLSTFSATTDRRSPFADR